MDLSTSHAQISEQILADSVFINDGYSVTDKHRLEDDYKTGTYTDSLKDEENLKVPTISRNRTFIKTNSKFRRSAESTNAGNFSKRRITIPLQSSQYQNKPRPSKESSKENKAQSTIKKRSPKLENKVEENKHHSFDSSKTSRNYKSYKEKENTDYRKQRKGCENNVNTEICVSNKITKIPKLFKKLTKSAEAKIVTDRDGEKRTLNENVKFFPNSLRIYGKTTPKSLTDNSSRNFNSLKRYSKSSLNLRRSVCSSTRNDDIQTNTSPRRSEPPTEHRVTPDDTNNVTLKAAVAKTTGTSTPKKFSTSLFEDRLSDGVVTRMIDWDMDSEPDDSIDEGISFSDIEGNVSFETLDIITDAEGQLDKLKDELTDMCEALSDITKKIGKIKLRQSLI